MHPGPVCSEGSKVRDEGGVEATETWRQVYILGTRTESRPFDDGSARYVCQPFFSEWTLLYMFLVEGLGWCRRANMKKAVLNPAWSTFIGCHMTRNVLADILNSGEWENPGDIEEPEDPYSCLPRIQGVLVKKA